MSTGAADPPSWSETPAEDQVAVDSGPLGLLPRLSRRQARLAESLARLGGYWPLVAAGAWWADRAGAAVESDHVEVLWRASGLGRPGVTAQWTWPRLATRVGLGLETTVAHALVDRLLGYDRLDGEDRLQVTPVEWGVLTFLAARALAGLREEPGPLGSWDLVLDRVGPQPFDTSDLGAIVTIRIALRLGSVAGSARLWVPETLVARWLTARLPPPQEIVVDLRGRYDDLEGVWHAEVATLSLPSGLGWLRAGRVLPMAGSPLRGTSQSPTGAIELALAARDGRAWFPAEPAPFSGGGRLIVAGPMRRDPTPREANAVNPPTDPPADPDAGVSPADVPVTLTVELGRVHLSIGRLADLRPGDVVELGRHSREPVELTSGGRLVARGELVQIDTELGVRIINVYL